MPMVAAAAGAALLPMLGRIAFGVALNIGFNYISKAFAPKQADTLQGPQGAVIQMQSGEMRGRSHIEGFYGTAGTLVYVGSWGGAAQSPNANLVVVRALSDLPISDITGILINGRRMSWNSSLAKLSAGSTSVGYAIPEYVLNAKNYITIRFFDGTQTAACAYLTAKFASAVHPWTSTGKGIGVAYAVVTYLVESKIFGSSPPEVVFEINGVPSYDRRKDSTAGGSGTQRWATPSTWTFTDNPAVIAYNLIRGRRYAGSTWVYGGQTYQEAQLPLSEWAAAMNECDVVVTNKDASTNKQYRAGGEIFWNSIPADEIEEFAKTCNMKVVDSAGQLKPHVGAPPTPTFSITDLDIVISDEQLFDPFHPFDHVVNTVEPSYIHPNSGWREKSIKRWRDPAHVTLDGARELSVEARYLRVWEGRQAARLSGSIEMESRRERKHVITLPAWAYPYEPVVDGLTWTSTLNGYTAKGFVIDAITLLKDGRVRFYIVETNPAEYSWTPATDEPTIATGAYEDVLPASQAVLGFTATAVTLTMAGGRARPAILVTWTPVEDISGIDYEIRRTSDSVVVGSGVAGNPDAGQYYITDGVVSATPYEVRVRYRPRSDRNTDWTAWTAVTATTTVFVTPEYGVGSITTVNIANNAITNLLVAANAIDTVNIVDNAITSAEVAANAITTVKIADNAITNLKVAADAIATVNIQDNAITSAEVAANAITTVKIADSAITNLKVAADAIATVNIQDNAITSAEVAADAITTVKIADNAITSLKIIADAITAVKIADNAVTNLKILADAITTVKISNNAITSLKIIADAITTVKILDNAVTVLASAYTGAAIVVHTNGATSPAPAQEVIVQTVVLTTTGNPVEIHWSFTCDTADVTSFDMDIERDGTAVLAIAGLSTFYNGFILTMPFVVAAASGAHTWTMRITPYNTGGGSGDRTWNIRRRFLSVKELKK